MSDELNKLQEEVARLKNRLLYFLNPNLREINLGYCPNCNEYFWDFGEKVCPNSRSNKLCEEKYEKLLMREVKR